MAKAKRRKLTLTKKEERNRHRWIGIDPGVNGALAYFDWIDLAVLHAFPLPTLKSGTGNKRELDLQGMRSVIGGSDLPSCVVALEDVHAMPKQGVTSSFNFGKAVGQIEAMVWTLGMPMVLVRPQAWKSRMGLLRKPKEASLKMAQTLWPKFEWGLNKSHAINMADASLMALYAKLERL